MERIVTEFERANGEKLAALGVYGSATVHEAMSKRGSMASRINPLERHMKCCGSAVTVKMQAGDNLTLIKAIDMAQAGDVLVVDNGSVSEEGPWGEILSIAAMERGIAGLIIDGSVRDSSEICELGFPVFCTGTCITGTAKDTFGWINQPIACGGAIVHAGDVVLADADGVVVIPAAEIDDAIELSRRRTEKETGQIARLRAGERITDIAGIDAILTRKGII